ncbi:MAG: UvrB/UvrC motif-containing protein, partial [Bacteroidales bacterium]|nr:UvrB/UvrC motif-containing protein [Bacteroidales bacterium]
EELTKYLTNLGIRSKYVHSDVDTLERVEIMRDLRMGVFDVLVGVNLLREGLDLPEVSLVAILDADKEGFLRSDRALIQTIGRAARNVKSRAILYADKITASMQRAIDETNRHREKQINYNREHNIVPRQIVKSTEAILGQTSVIDMVAEQRAEYSPKEYKVNTEVVQQQQASEPRATYRNADALKKEIRNVQRNMQKAAKEMNYMEAARYRDMLKELQDMLAKMTPKE